MYVPAENTSMDPACKSTIPRDLYNRLQVRGEGGRVKLYNTVQMRGHASPRNLQWYIIHNRVQIKVGEGGRQRDK